MDTRTITVVVNEEHIRFGRQHDCCNCPVALALRDAGVMWTAVTPSEISVCAENDGAVSQIVTPFRVRDFISVFDHGLPAEPFSFDIDVPAYVLQSEAA